MGQAVQWVVDQPSTHYRKHKGTWDIYGSTLDLHWIYHESTMKEPLRNNEGTITVWYRNRVGK